MHTYRLPLAIVVLLLLGLVPGKGYAQSVKTGYKSLEKKEFEKAYQAFEKNLEKSPVEASLAMAELRGTKDSANTYYSLDTAFIFVSEAEAIFCRFEQEERDALIKSGIHFEMILAERDTLYDRALAEARDAQTVDALEHFLDFYSRYPGKRSVELERDSLAYTQAVANGTSGAYKAFLERYPTARQFPDARKGYDDALFKETAAIGTLDAYLNFLQDYPRSEHAGDAQDSVYALVIPTPPTELALYDFTQKYPRNRNYSLAWRELYQLVCYDYMEDTYLAFLEKYPTFPNKSLAYEDLDLAREVLLPAHEGNQQGFVRATNGKPATEFVYGQLRPFSENLAAVAKVSRWVFINKAGNPVFKETYQGLGDFHHGLAPAAENDAWGFVTKRGEWAIAPTYEAIDYLGAGRWGAKKDGTWQLLAADGTPLTEPLYTSLTPILGGISCVAKDGVLGTIDTLGRVVLPTDFSQLRLSNTGLAVLARDSVLGVATPGGYLDTAAVAEVLVIPNGMGLVRKGERFYYVDAVDNWHEDSTRWAWHESLRPMLAASAPAGRPLLRREDGELGYLDAAHTPVWVPGAEALVALHATETGAVGYRSGGKWGIRDAGGTLVLPPTYDSLAALNGPFAAIRSGNKWGVVSLSGRLVVPLQYDRVEFVDALGLFRVGVGEKVGLVNDRGLEVLSPQFDSIEPAAESIVRVQVTGKEAFVRLEATTVNYLWKESGFPEFVR